MTNKAKVTYWQKHILDWRQSDLTQTAYCIQHDLKLATFSYWRKRFAGPISTGKLIPLSAQLFSEPMIIISAGRLRIEVPLNALEQTFPIIHRGMLETD